MTKHNRIADPDEAMPSVPAAESGEHIRALSELADELQRCGMSKAAGQVRNAVKFIRKLVRQ